MPVRSLGGTHVWGVTAHASAPLLVRRALHLPSPLRTTHCQRRGLADLLACFGKTVFVLPAVFHSAMAALNYKKTGGREGGLGEGHPVGR